MCTLNTSILGRTPIHVNATMSQHGKNRAKLGTARLWHQAWGMPLTTPEELCGNGDSENGAQTPSRRGQVAPHRIK